MLAGSLNPMRTVPRARSRVATRALACASALCAAAVVATLMFAPVLMSTAAAADELLVYQLVARDGTLSPKTIEVPAGKRFKIEISNEGTAPIEFESRALKQEKVLAGGAKSSVVINPLKPGTYPFFDDYHPDTSAGQVVVK